MAFLNRLTQTKTLWFTGLLTLLLTACFWLVMHVGQFGIIDEMYNAEKISAHIAAMTPKQKQFHIWTTATLDVAYPLAYGSFFIGIALRCYGRYSLWFALPSLLVIPVDLTEGFAQIMLLSGHETFIGLKCIATPLKLTLFIAGLIITLGGLTLAAKAHLSAKEPQR